MDRRSYIQDGVVVIWP